MNAIKSWTKLKEFVSFVRLLHDDRWLVSARESEKNKKWIRFYQIFIGFWLIFIAFYEVSHQSFMLRSKKKNGAFQ